MVTIQEDNPRHVHQTEPITGGRWGAYGLNERILWLSSKVRTHHREPGMANYHLHSCSKSQYERYLDKWGYKKKVPARVWGHIGKQVRERDDAGKESEVIIRGVPVPPKKWRKEIQRYKCSFESTTFPNEGNFACYANIDSFAHSNIICS